jgi:hypothetical protein
LNAKILNAIPANSPAFVAELRHYDVDNDDVDNPSAVEACRRTIEEAAPFAFVAHGDRRCRWRKR